MPLDLEPQRVVSDRAHSGRVVTRLVSALSAILALLAFAGAKKWIAPELGTLALTLLPIALILAGWSGLRTRAQALADRDTESGRAMIVAIAAQLGRQDDATLEQIQRKGGPAGDAARMILQGRRKRSGTAG